jgi:hypothetical protein
MKPIPVLPAVPARATAPGTRVMRRPQRALPPAARTATVMIAIVGLALLAAACSGSPASSGPGGSSNAGGSANSQLLAFSRCMRSHGVPSFPDPSSSNVKVPGAQQLGVSSSQLQAAENACQHLLPVGTNDQFPPAEVQLLLPGMRRFSQCMRSHGLPNFPDPTTDSQGRPVFPVSSAGISLEESHSPPFDTAMQECERVMPSQLGGVPLG